MRAQEQERILSITIKDGEQEITVSEYTEVDGTPITNWVHLLRRALTAMTYNPDRYIPEPEVDFE